jgi:RyR domain
MSPMSHAEIARICHEANRALCAAFGDLSQPAWEDAPAWQRESAIKGVQFHLAHPDAGPEASHNAWKAHKEADGWTFGKVKDPDRKMHPCMVPFSMLPTDQQAKDFIFRAIVHASV